MEGPLKVGVGVGLLFFFVSGGIRGETMYMVIEL